jgi:hypothetical protein
MTRPFPFGPEGFAAGFPGELIRTLIHRRTISVGAVPTPEARAADEELAGMAPYLGAEVLALRDRIAQVEAEKTAMQDAVREWFAACEALEEAESAAEHAWGRAASPATEALERSRKRHTAAAAQLRALTGAEAVRGTTRSEGAGNPPAQERPTLKRTLKLRCPNSLSPIREGGEKHTEVSIDVFSKVQPTPLEVRDLISHSTGRNGVPSHCKLCSCALVLVAPD